MRCPFCRIASMRKVVAGETEIDRCLACGALWFDRGEVRALTEGRLAVDPPEDGTPSGPRPAPGGGGEEPGPRGRFGPLLARMRREAAALGCPRCDAPLAAVNFQATGIPVFRCGACGGLLAPRASAAAVASRFRDFREHAAQLAVLGEAAARRERIRMEEEFGPARSEGLSSLPLPVVVPLADEAPGVGSQPILTWILAGLAVLLHAAAAVRGITPALPGGLPGLPSGTGFLDVPKGALLVYPFLHAGIVPLAAAVLFLLVLGDNVEDRLGRLPYLLFYLFCGAVAGAAHVLWGDPGEAAALGAAGAVAGVLGAYLVFFPEVSIRMYGMGRVVSLPAYVFACAWVAAAFLTGPGLLTDLINPAPLSLAGSLAGFGAGVLWAILWRLTEEASLPSAPPA